MINIVTKVGNNDRVVRDAESYFNVKVKPDVRNFAEVDLNVMKKIDGAVLLDSNLGTIQTKFGITNIKSLSSGCKTILSYLYMKRNSDSQGDKILDITECGANALEMLFQCVDYYQDSKTVFLLGHTYGLLYVKDRDYCIDGKFMRSLNRGVWANV